MKICSKCAEELPLANFCKSKHGRLGLESRCKKCNLARWLLWEKRNHLKVLERNRIRRRTPEFRAKVKASIKKWRSIPHNRIAERLRNSLKRGIKGIKKSASTEQLLGCSFEFLKTYLESKFFPGMNWDNVSMWHIDHIRPCSSFDLTIESEQRECFHYTNLQPLWAKDNIAKGARWAAQQKG